MKWTALTTVSLCLERSLFAISIFLGRREATLIDRGATSFDFRCKELLCEELISRVYTHTHVDCTNVTCLFYTINFFDINPRTLNVRKENIEEYETINVLASQGR